MEASEALPNEEGCFCGPDQLCPLCEVNARECDDCGKREHKVNMWPWHNEAGEIEGFHCEACFEAQPGLGE